MMTFNRQGFLGKEFESSLTDKIAVVGICGGGSHVVMHLCYMGFRNLVFIDFDDLEDSNLTRMVLAKKEDVGKNKAQIALDFSKELNGSNINKALPNQWQDSTSTLKKCKYIFSCMDSIEEREQLEMFCRRNDIIMIDIGMNVTKNSATDYSISGQVFLSVPHRLCMKCFDFFNPKNNPRGEYGEAGPVPQVVFTNGILASNAVNSFVKFVSKTYGHKEPSLYKTYDSENDDFICHPLVDVLSKKGCQHY